MSWNDPCSECMEPKRDCTCKKSGVSFEHEFKVEPVRPIKFRLLSCNQRFAFETRLNKFAENNEILNTEFSTSTLRDRDIVYSVLLTYKEKPKKDDVV